MILVYFGVLLLSGLITWALKSLGFRHYWLVGLVVFLAISIALTVWLNWKIKSGPYP